MSFACYARPESPLTQSNAVLEHTSASGEVTCMPLVRLQQIVGRSVPPAEMVDIDVSRLKDPAHRSVSRRHAEFRWVDGELLLRDLRSRAGTQVNGGPVVVLDAQSQHGTRLRDGDIVQLGDLRVVVRADRSRT